MQGRPLWLFALACLLMTGAGAVADDAGGTLSVRGRGTAMAASQAGLSPTAAQLARKASRIVQLGFSKG